MSTHISDNTKLIAKKLCFFISEVSYEGRFLIYEPSYISWSIGIETAVRIIRYPIK